MNNLTNVTLTPYEPSIYTQPLSLHVWQRKIHRAMNLFMERESVAIIIYNATRKVLVFVKQFRPAVYAHDLPAKDLAANKPVNVHKHPPSKANPLELCAGLVDKDVPLVQIAQEEVLEEVGYKVSIDQLEKVCTFSNGVTTTGAFQSMYYCEVTDDMKVAAGGGVDDELIDIVEMSVAEAKNYVLQGSFCSPGTMGFGVLWFLRHKQ